MPTTTRIPTRVWLPGTAIAVAAAVLVFALVLIPYEGRERKMQERIAVLTKTIDGLKSDLADALQSARLWQSPTVDFVKLAGGEPQPDAWGRIAWDMAHRTCEVHVFDMQPTGAGKTYELWLITSDGKKYPAGTFDVDETGYGELLAEIPANLDKVDRATVTDEPAGGAPQPTGSIQLFARIDVPS